MIYGNAPPVMNADGLAYMWLHLPLRAQLSYNSSDTMFMVWADFVIMGTIREEELNVREEERFYTGH